MKKIITQPLAFCLVLLAIAAFQTEFAMAQNAVRAIRGKVIDKKDKLPVIGATVTEIDKEKRTLNGVTTDIDGNFVLRVSNPQNKISVSFLGYKTSTYDVGNRTVLDVQLEGSSNELTEVVVTGRKTSSNGLLEIDERSSTVSVARVNAKDLEEMSATSIDQALQGRLPGVDFAANSGDPGAGMQIRIRGTSTINGSTEPLIVVDGMPYETEIPEDFNFGTADEQGYASLLNIAPSDIQDISVLKDAAATAVWGSRASNGVLIINTKRGRLGKPVVSYAVKGTMANQPAAIPMLSGDQFSMLIPEAFMNRNGSPLNTQTVKELQYDISDPYYFNNYSNNTNWIDAITQTGFKQDHNVSINGGGEKARYYASVGYLGEKGTTIGTGLNRISTRINLDYNVSNKIKFRTDIAYTHSITDKIFSDNARRIAYDKMPNMSVYEYDAQGNNTGIYLSPLQNIQGAYAGTYNPVAMLNEATNEVIGERITPHFNLQYDFMPEFLKATVDVQFDIENSKNKSFLPQIATGRPINEVNVNRAYDGDRDAFRLQTKTNLVFTPKLGENHSFIGLVSLLSNDDRSTSLQSLTSNSASPQLQDPTSPSRTQNLSSSFSQVRSVAALINGQYGYKDKYIVNAGLRADANSKFGPANRSGLFPSISTRWRISGENFLKDVKVINDLSLRASYGQSGRAPKTNYGFYNIYNNYDWDYLGNPAVYSSNIELRNLRWETVTGRNLGLNVILFNNKLDFDVDVYRMRTTDLFFPDLSIPSISGYNNLDMNVGTMDNQGWEINLRANPLKTKNWNLNLSFNFARNVNVIREISEFYPRESGNTNTNGQYKRFLQVDNPFGSFYGYRFKGVYTDADATVARDKNDKPLISADGTQVPMRFDYPNTDYVFQPGDAMYEDVNHDGNINYMDVVYLGNGNPKFIGGFGPEITFKGNLKLTAFFSFRYKYDVINQTKMISTNMYEYDNQSTAVLRRWRNPGDVTNIPRALYNSGYNWLGSDRYVEDASFVRLKTLTMRYNFTKPLLDKMKLKNLGVYFTAENLLTFTTYTGQDPEVSPRLGNPFALIQDNSMTPPTRNMVFGLTAGF
ncbi:SusC/RagA family TonB-linked outer membrane protein [Pedobacter sp. P351]|uniref:SusC/RagA family TonB-linked outer membrane protein n=1 Tax=Pedobacter superstes TaxID=3133441 RepID=UPI0030A999E7